MTFEINRTQIKGGCQSGRKVVTHNSKSDLPLLGESVPKMFVKSHAIYKSQMREPSHIHSTQFDITLSNVKDTDPKNSRRLEDRLSNPAPAVDPTSLCRVCPWRP